MWQLALIITILVLNLAYVGSKIVDDARARRWRAVLVGGAGTIGIYGIIMGGIYLAIASSTDL